MILQRLQIQKLSFLAEVTLNVCNKGKKIGAVVWRCSVEKVFLEISQKITGKDLCQRLWHRCFLVNFTKFLRTPFFTEHLRWLLLKNDEYDYLQVCLYRWLPKVNAIYLRVHQMNRTIQAHIIPRKKYRILTFLFLRNIISLQNNDSTITSSLSKVI